MTIKFDRPVGTPADIKELEYLSALHQTCPKLRQDASIDATDILNLLSSRHGLLVDVEDVKQKILVELGGEFDSDNPLYKLDLCQVVAILLIPHLLQKGNEGKALERVLAVLVSEVVSPTLSRDFMKQVLDFHGEIHVSEETLDAMIAVAGGEGTKLDTTSLLQALTSDVSLYHTEWTHRLSTHYQDVFSTFDQGEPITEEGTSLRSDEENPDIIGSKHPSVHEENIVDGIKIQLDKHRSSSSLRNDKQSMRMRKIWTASSIDQVADTYSSQSFTVLLWASMILVYLGYFFKFDISWGTAPCNPDSFGCKIVNGITSWLVIFVELSAFGTAYIFLGSAGNSIYDNKWIAVGRLLIGIVTILFATILSVAFVVDTVVFSTEKQVRFLAAYWGAAILGGMLLIIQFISLVREFVPLNFLHKHACLEALFTPGMGKMERRTKVAAQNKVTHMVDNALVYHTEDSQHGLSLSKDFKMTARGTALLNFQSREETTERVGGIWYWWKRVLNGSVFNEEGIWLHSRLVSSTVTQFFICIFLVVFFAIVLLEIMQRFNAKQASENPDEAEQDSSSSSGVTVYLWEAGVAGTAGLLSGIGACFAIAMIYIPSFISSCIKFRTGVFPSLRDRNFEMYRVAVDLVTNLYGSAFWGCICTGLLATVLIGGVVFFAVWHESRAFVMTIIAQLIGIGVTIGVKQVVLLLLRRQFLAAFYRRMPLKNNLMNVMLEAWNIGLSSGVMVMRTCKLLLVTAFFLGRLDTPLLADGIGFIGPIALDSYPISFRKDLLQHDAHRHPYLERLATMYMMKLRYGSDFGHRANSCWRLLFVLCLMPWMRKYRLCAFPSLEGLEVEIEEAEAELAAEEEAIVDEYDQPDKTLQRAATRRRLESMRNLKSLHTIGTAASREELLEREVTILRERNRQLLGQVKQLGGNPASSRRNLYQESTAPIGVFPDRRGNDSVTGQLSLVPEEENEGEESKE